MDEQIRAIHAAGILKHRKTQKKKKATIFDRRYFELGPLFKPDFKRIDYVLVHSSEKSVDAPSKSRKKSLQNKERLRKRFEDALRQTGFSIGEVTVKDKVYKMLHCPFKRLCEEAERVKLEMPLTGFEQYPPHRRSRLRKIFDELFKTDNEVDFISASFKMNRIKMFKGYENPITFFRPSLRSLLTHHILINADIKAASDSAEKTAAEGTLQAVDGFINDCCFSCSCLWPSMEGEKEDKLKQKIGLPCLLMKEVYEDAFVLHEDSNISGENEENSGTSKKTDKSAKKKDLSADPRKELNDTWCRWWKFQPLWKIRNYFGEKIGLYFAWAGMLFSSLWLPMLFGLACFFYGLYVSVERAQESEQMPANLTFKEQFQRQLTDLYGKVNDAFDNNTTPFFAFVICLWGTIFLELWKRENAKLAYEWDVDNFEANEPDRPEFFGTNVREDPVTREDNWFYPFWRQLIKFSFSASTLIFMVSIVFIGVVAVVVYRAIISVDYCINMTTVQCLVATTIISSVLNAVSILLLGKGYDWLAVKLTDWENHRTQTQYDDALIIKLFAFQFANSYASCFYIAFFRGRFDGVFGLGEEYSDACEEGSCMSQLSFQVLVLMLAKPFPKFLKDIILPFIERCWRNRPECCRRSCCKNKVDDEEILVEKEKDTLAIEDSSEFLRRNHLKPELGDFTLGEYTEKVILYGFLMLFAASFPLAPLIAMLWLAIDIRIDAKRLLWLNRRPVAFIAQDIGMWYAILSFVNLVGVISNGFLIAFTSQWGLKYDLITRLWICISFEHIVFAIKFVLAYMIPDVPDEIKLSLRRKKYQVSKLMEGKTEDHDYTELIPKDFYDSKVHKNSGNFTKFADAGADNLKATLKTQTEEDAKGLSDSIAHFAGTNGLAETAPIRKRPLPPLPTEVSTQAKKHELGQKPSFITEREDSTRPNDVVRPVPAKRLSLKRTGEDGVGKPKSELGSLEDDIEH